MPTTRRPRPPQVVLPYCHNCKPVLAKIVHAERPTPETCAQCGRETLSGVYAIEKATE